MPNVSKKINAPVARKRSSIRLLDGSTPIKLPIAPNPVHMLQGFLKAELSNEQSATRSGSNGLSFKAVALGGRDTLWIPKRRNLSQVPALLLGQTRPLTSEAKSDRGTASSAAESQGPQPQAATPVATARRRRPKNGAHLPGAN